jgi:hypothetical protein
MTGRMTPEKRKVNREWNLSAQIRPRGLTECRKKYGSRATKGNCSNHGCP